MATFTKHTLSASSGGRPIKVTQTSTPGTLIHSTGTSDTVIDEIWLYATNTSSTQTTLTLEIGGTTSPDDLIEVGIPSKSGLSLVLAGNILTGTGAASRSITAFALTGDVVNIVGYVNRIS